MGNFNVKIYHQNYIYTSRVSFYLELIFQCSCSLQLPPTCEQDQDAKLDLCLKYLQSLPRAQVESRNTDISIVFDLLRGMREVLQTDLIVSFRRFNISVHCDL